MGSSKKTFEYYAEVEEKDGTIRRYAIRRKGKSIFITNPEGYEQLMHPSARSVEDEIRIVFGGRMLRRVFPGQL